MEYRDILTDLNEAQNAAVTTDAAYALILAGAGSGKQKFSYTGWLGTYKRAKAWITEFWQ